MTDVLTNYGTFFPSFLPSVMSETMQKWITDLEQSFRQPIKQTFSYPIDVRKVYNKSTGKLIKLVFDVALAGIPKNAIHVQLKKGKYLYIKVNPNEIANVEDQRENAETVESEEYEEFVNKAISHRDCEISFRIFNDVDLEKFKPVFENGILTIELFLKETEDDVVDAVID